MKKLLLLVVFASSCSYFEPHHKKSQSNQNDDPCATEPSCSSKEPTPTTCAEGEVLSEDGKACVGKPEDLAALCKAQDKVLNKDGKECVEKPEDLAATCKAQDKVLNKDGKECVEKPEDLAATCKAQDKVLNEDGTACQTPKEKCEADGKILANDGHTCLAKPTAESCMASGLILNLEATACREPTAVECTDQGLARDNEAAVGNRTCYKVQPEPADQNELLVCDRWNVDYKDKCRIRNSKPLKSAPFAGPNTVTVTYNFVCSDLFAWSRFGFANALFTSALASVGHDADAAHMKDRTVVLTDATDIYFTTEKVEGLDLVVFATDCSLKVKSIEFVPRS